VTFTARAIIENPYEAYQIIKKIEKDPFWDVFVLPSVVALIDELANETDATGHKYECVASSPQYMTNTHTPVIAAR